MSVDGKNISFELEDDAEVIALEWSLDQLKVQEMMGYMVEIGLFENSNGRITCLKLAKRLDDTNSKNPEIRNLLSKLNSKSLGDTPNNSEQLRTDKIRLDKTRLEENKDITPVAVAPVEQKKTNSVNSKYTTLIEGLFEQFWLAGMRKVGKKETLSKFRITMRGKNPEQFTGFLINDVQKRIKSNQYGFDKLHPQRYLKHERWNDEAIKNDTANQPIDSSDGWSTPMQDPNYLES